MRDTLQAPRVCTATLGLSRSDRSNDAGPNGRNGNRGRQRITVRVLLDLRPKSIKTINGGGERRKRVQKHSV